jgi:prolyl-tRNA editing enzyme YbaK/EbsC (Cys-tRNA(Pro) deacylase)
VDRQKVSDLLGGAVEPADGNWVRKATGFAIGGVAPVGHAGGIKVLIDEDLTALSPVWAAAGSPMHAFRTETATLRDMTGGRIADIKET